jgi:hypothetical protein
LLIRNIPQPFTPIARLMPLGAIALLLASCGGGGSPTSPSETAISITGSGVTTYTYTANIRPLLTTDCTSCHNSSQHEAGYDFTTYAGVMRAVTPGSDASLLVRVTQPGGLMYANLSGDRGGKAGIIYDWVVHSNAAQ